MILLVRILIGVVAVGVGGKNLWDYWQNRKAESVVCKVSKNYGTKKTFDKIKDIVYRKSLWWSILGIVILGFSVNLVELACSAGFPAIYTQVLALNGLPMWQKYLYMGGYIFFYMLDDLIVFLVAMLTLKSKVFGTKYAKYSNLIGGLLILILGLLLIFRPEWLMFS
jgi:cytochrome c biogenesis protein CcdA